ncbi:alpha/beta fold hydrolase [Nesterenkonia natronophila]|uniref:Alpha/beta fold hydrolase n=1 Tax=Nesterenkonia natronophila TaxID=2174932 RepID=A0A3A4FAF6_9MICC|nr:alpha/beta fold hydrolase [Nesterenkonia natronophila]RJN32137.1 alpha/beta fold hydrolase [Nesterenkonia natronophila]
MAEDRLTINTQTVGDSGEIVAFLPGLFGQGKNFTQIAKGLQPDFQSVLVDLPNHGASDWTQEFDYTAQADLVAEHLRRTAASDGPINLVGHSMGGKVAMVLALRHPDLVSRLVVVDISPVERESMDEFEHLLDSLAALDIEDLKSRGEADTRLQEPIPEDMVRGFLLQSLSRTSEGFQWKVNLKLLRDLLPTIAGFPDLTDSTYEGPVLWIAGEKSDYVKDKYGPAMRELFPRTTLTTINNAGHWVHAEQAEVFTNVVRGFLSGADACNPGEG